MGYGEVAVFQEMNGDEGLSEASGERLGNQQGAMQLSELTIGDALSPTRVAKSLRTSKAEIASTLGLGKDAFSRKEMIKAAKTQTRLREMLEILGRVESEAGSPLEAYAWYRTAHLPGYGHQTPDQLVRDGHADWVNDYLDHVMAGGYAQAKLRHVTFNGTV